MSQYDRSPDPNQTPGGFNMGGQTPDPFAPRGENLPLAIVAGALAAAAAGGLLYTATAILSLGQAVPVLAVGPLVGLAVRFAGRGSTSRFGVVAIVLTFVGAGTAFVLADLAIWDPPIVKAAFRRMFSLQGIMVFGFSAYFSWLIAIVGSSYRYYAPAPSPQAPVDQAPSASSTPAPPTASAPPPPLEPDPPAEPGHPRFCSSCGHKLGRSRANSCPECGAYVDRPV